MQITAPVTDYIPSSILTAQDDLVIRGAAIPGRQKALSRFSAYRNANYALASGAYTLVEFNTETFDRNGEYNNATFRFVPVEDGYYYFHCGVCLQTLNIGKILSLQLRLDNVPVSQLVLEAYDGIFPALQVGRFLYVTTAMRVEVFASQDSGGAKDIFGSIHQTFFEGFQIP